VDEETDRLNTMLTEAIQMSRIEASQLQLHRSPQAVSGLVCTQLERLAESLEGRKVDVEVPENLPRVSVDSELIGTVIWQLLNNALQYAPPDSPLTIRARAEEGAVVVSVEDCGPGISEQEQRQIFERFYRGREHRQRIPGTGMGLSIAQEIVRAHQGRIWVESQPGKGAKFSFSLPCAAKESAL
jgi:two-component system sensor histidine kinase KdpD